MARAPLTMRAPDDTISSFQALPVGFVRSTIIQMPLQQASQEFSTLLLKELRNLTMLEVLRLL